MAQALSQDALLASWERGQDRDALERGVTLWRTVEPDTPVDALASAPIGRRDHALLDLRIATFGSRAECFVDCPTCDEQLEFELDLRTLAVDAPPPPADGPAAQVEGWSVRFRLPGSRDVAAVAGAGDPLGALLERCIQSVTHDGRRASLGQLPPQVVKAVEDEMRRLDPQAAVELVLECDACGHRWTTVFDIVSFLWREIDVAARRLLWEVHALARTYGWSQHEILSLAAVRRRTYLQLSGAL